MNGKWTKLIFSIFPIFFVIAFFGCTKTYLTQPSLVAGLDKEYQISVNDDGSIKVHEQVSDLYDFNGWEGIKSIVPGIINVGGLRDDGGVVVTGENKDGACDVQSWSNIKAMAFTFFTTFGLQDDGTIIHTAHGSLDGIRSIEKKIIDDVDDWKDIVDIKGAQFVMAGIKKNGRVVVSAPTLPEFEEGVRDWRNVRDISVSMSMILGLTWEGEVLCVYDNFTNKYTDKESLLQYQELKGAEKVFAGQTFVAGLMPDGLLKVKVIQPGYKDEEELLALDGMTNIKDANNYEEYLAVLKNDGTVLVAGYIE